MGMNGGQFLIHQKSVFKKTQKLNTQEQLTEMTHNKNVQKLKRANKEKSLKKS